MGTISDYPSNVSFVECFHFSTMLSLKTIWNLDEVNFVGIPINGILTDTTKESKSVLVSYLEKVDNDGVKVMVGLIYSSLVTHRYRYISPALGPSTCLKSTSLLGREVLCFKSISVRQSDLLKSQQVDNTT